MEDENVPEHFKEVVKGSFWNLVGNLMFKAVSFFYYVLVARAASQGELDLFFLSLGIIAILDPLDDFGLSTSLSRYIPFLEGSGKKGRVKELVASGFAVSVVSSVILASLVFWQADLIASLYRNASLAAALRMLCATLVLSNIGKMANSFMQAQKDMKGMQAFQNLQNVLKLAITALMFGVYGPTVLSLVIGAVLSSALSLALFLPLVLRRLLALPGRVFSGMAALPLFSEVLSFGLALGAMNVAGSALFSSDVALLGYFSGISGQTGVVAVYSVAYSLAIALTALPYSMDSIFLPLMAGFHGRREMAKMAETTEAAQRWAFLIVIPPALVFMAMPAYILTTIFGESYAAGSAVLALFALNMTISALYHPLSLALSSMRMVRRSVAAYIPGGLIFFALSFVLIPVLGITGPPLALVVSSLFMLLIYYREAGAALRLGGMGCLARMALGGAATLALMLLAVPFLLSMTAMLPSFEGFGAAQVYLDKGVRIAYLAVPAAFASLLFGGSVLLMKCLKADDVAIFRRALRKMRVPAVLAAWLGGVASHGVGGGPRVRV